MSYVYVIGKSNAFKVGYSDNVWRRRAQMQTASEERLEVWGIAPGGRLEEQELHRRLQHYRLVGEWFEACPESLAIAAMALADNGANLLRWTLRKHIEMSNGVHLWATYCDKMVECISCGTVDEVRKMNMIADSPSVNLWDDHWGYRIFSEPARNGEPSGVTHVPLCNDCFDKYRSG